MDITKTIAVYGKSGHGKVVADIAKENGYTTILWIDDNPKKEALCFLDFIERYDSVPVALGVGDNYQRESIMQKLLSYEVEIPALIHPRAAISDSVNISRGSVIMANTVLNADAVIGEGVIVNSGSIVEHDCTIQGFVHISPNCALGGGVTVGKRTHVGIGSSIIQGVVIGEDAILGAGTVVIQDIPSSVMVAGVPGKVKKEL